MPSRIGSSWARNVGSSHLAAKLARKPETASSPKLGAPYTYVTTETFLAEFGFESLRDLPDLEALKDAGLAPAAGQLGARDREAEADDAGDRLPLPEVSQDSAA